MNSEASEVEDDSAEDYKGEEANQLGGVKGHGHGGAGGATAANPSGRGPSYRAKAGLAFNH